jgi:hypothetical protein
MTESRSLTIPSKTTAAIVPQPPLVIVEAATNARFAWDEFFAAQIRNPHTRAAYSLAIRRFFTWLEPRNIALTDIEPATVGVYFAEHPGSVPTKKLHLAGNRPVCPPLRAGVRYRENQSSWQRSLRQWRA